MYPEPRTGTRVAILLAAVATLLAATPARALDVGYYEMCFGEGTANQATAITNAGHTAINLTDLTAAELAAVDVIMVDNCENGFYAQEYLDRLADVDAAVAAGAVLVLHDRYVDAAETILPGGSSFDVQRHAVFPDPNGEATNIDVVDPTTSVTNGPAGVIDDTTLDGGNFSNHGFAIAGSLPGSGKLILSTNDPTHIVTFVYTYGAGAVMYSSIPLDFYRGGSSNFATIYAVNVVDYAAYLVGSCGNGVLDPGEDCDLGAGNGDPGTCCTAACGFESAGTVCRTAAGECDPAESCDGASAACPADGFEPAGVACSDDGEACTDDECDGAGSCAHPAKPDTDSDGTCDEQDACTNAGGGQDFVPAKPRPNVTFTKVNNDTTPGNDGFRLSGEFTLSSGKTFADVDPGANGVRILVEGDGGEARVDQALPGGTYGGRGTRGWKANPAGTAWTYTDTTSSPLSGIKRMRITDRSKAAPRRVRVTLSGTRSTYPVVAADAPLQAVAVLGDQAAAIAGLCGETAFNASSCKLNGAGSTLTCK